MEWHFGSDIDDLAVPRDEEIFNRFPSPGNWWSWGKSVVNFNSAEKFTVSGVDEFLNPDITFSSEVEQLTTPHLDQDSRRAFHEWNACPLEHSDPELNDIALINEADDIFFRSLFEDAAETDGDESSSKFTQTSSQDNVISVHHPGEWNHIQNCTNNNVGIGPSPEQFEEPVFGIHAADKHSDIHDDVCKSMTLEESVLLELQRSTMQLTKKTRLCFRDSLYRLAENSRHHTKNSKNGKATTKYSKPAASRLRHSKSRELDTNAIDRTVATLLFSTPSSPLPQLCLPGQTPQRETYKPDSHMHKQRSSISHLCSLPRHDAEVPTFGQTGQLLPPLRCHHTYSSTASSMQV